MPRVPPLTGYDLARQHGASVVIGQDAAYLWNRRLVVLPRTVALGSDAHALVVAAHETAHHLQHREIPWIFYLRIFEPARWWQEMNAWRRAERLLSALAARL